ncbi:acyltransferase family protein [Clostridium puniceum]|uniref:Acyltransferase family protein n=1 Tax=Clostridium puniceum TaxID=29367 RepID=A0A1S8TEV9_9CLOT|nr:acyltransferase family protein [Clostridium puniceum]OOM76323.1 acyltransferase family protein [Clostridium puniceum]
MLKEENLITTDKKQRSSNFELLRIICIILIVLYHCTGAIGSPNKLSLNRFVLTSTGSWGILGVDCFFLVSAYFLKDGKFKSRKLFELILQVAFYAIPFFIFFIIYQAYYVHDQNIVNTVIKQFYIGLFLNPLFSNLYWFITAYLFLYLSVPFLNIFLLSLSKDKLHKFIIILTIIIPIYGMTKVGYSVIEDYAYVVYIYILQFYLSQKNNNWFEKYAKIGFFTCTFIIFFSMYIAPEIHISIGMEFYYYTVANTGRHSAIMLLDALFLFNMFKNIKINYSKTINLISSTTLGIYLFHEYDYLKLRDLTVTLFKDWTGCQELNQMWYMPMFYFSEVVLILIFGVLIDLIRQRIFNATINKVLESKYKHILKKFDYWMNE